MRHLMSRVADYFREADKIILILSFFASLYGVFAVYSATYYMESFRPAFIQFIAMILGLISAIVISTIDYEKIAKYWYLVALLGLVPVILTFFFGFAPEGTDDKAWLDLGFTTFQPSELLKICFCVTFGLHLKKIKPNHNKNLKI